MQLLKFIKKLSPTTVIRKNFSEIIKEKYPYQTKIFMEVSKPPNGTDFALVENNKTSIFEPPPETRIFSTESKAIKKAISPMTTLVAKEILIISDSLSALLVLENPMPKMKSPKPFKKYYHTQEKQFNAYGSPLTLV